MSKILCNGLEISNICVKVGLIWVKLKSIATLQSLFQTKQNKCFSRIITKPFERPSFQCFRPKLLPLNIQWWKRKKSYMAMNFWKKPEVQTPPRKIHLDFKLDLLLQFFFVNLRCPFPVWRSSLMTLLLFKLFC